MFDGEKLIKELEERMVENDKHIEDGMDGDDSCTHENDAFDTVIRMINSGKYCVEQSIHFIKEN